jgi:hypothetical protein
MKKIFPPLGILLILSSFSFSVFDYLPELYFIKTKYFDIIYSKNSRETAFYIASFADETFEKLQSILKTNHKERFRVIVSGDVEEANGYASVTPSYTTIVIFNVLPPMDSTVVNSKEFFKMEFLHELTHAMSLNIRNGFLEFLSGIFGNWLWSASSMPMSMMEGITVSFESLEGEGRINYPLIKQEIQQDIYEKKFRTPLQANGSYDGYLARHNFYHYGGYFSFYLQQKYGMEKYVQLWKNALESPIAGIGGAFFLNSSLWSFLSPYDQLKPIVGLAPLAVENVFVYPLAYYATYKKSIDEEWKEFEKFMEYKGKILVNTNLLTPPQKFNIEYPVCVNKKIYFIDHFDEGIVEFDIESKKYRFILLGEGINSISVTKDGKNLIVNRSYYRDRKNEIVKIFARKFDIKNKRFFGKKYEGVREASFFNDKLVAIKLRKHFTDIVMIDEKGNFETLVSGNENTIFGNPVQLNEEEVAFIVNDSGKMKIGRVNIYTKETYLLDVNIKFIRNLAVYDEKIYFSYNDEEGFYKLGFVDKEKIYLDDRNFSGGIFYPIAYNGEIYYVGKFSEGDTILKLPEERNLKTYDLKWVKKSFDKDKTETYIAKFNKDEKKYLPFFDLLPRAWIPYLSFQGEDIFKGIDGAGLMMYMVDPYRFNTIRLTGVYNYLLNFANLQLDWECSALPLHFNIGGYDRLIYYDDVNLYSSIIPKVIPYYIRYTGAYADLWNVINLDEPNQYIKIGERVGFNQILMDYDYITNLLLSDRYVRSSPYDWYFVYSRYIVFTTYLKFANYSMYHPYKFYDGNRGFEVNLFFDYYYSLTNSLGINTNIYQFEGGVDYYLYYLPVLVKLFGGYSAERSFRLSGNNRFLYNHFLNMYEYKEIKDSYQWYGGGDISVRILNFEIQNGISFIPFLYFNRLYITTGYRSCYVEDGYFHTGYLKANLVMPMLGGSDGLASYKMIMYLEGYYPVNTGNYGFVWGIDFGKQFEIE